MLACDMQDEQVLIIMLSSASIATAAGSTTKELGFHFVFLLSIAARLTEGHS
jgi:hypothetical protein